MSQAITQTGGAAQIPPSGNSGGGLIPPSNDNVTVEVDGKVFSDWDSVSVTVGLELMPSSFQVGYTALQPGEVYSVIAVAGMPCVVKLGNDPIVTGYVDGTSVVLTPNSHSLKMGGRGKCQDLVDCSVVIQNMVLNKPSAIVLAQDLAAPYGISVSSTITEPPDPIPQITVNIGETPFEIVDRVSRYRQFLSYEMPDGSLILTGVGTKKAASGFTEGVNIESISTQFSSNNRYSEYDIFWTSNNSLSNIQGEQQNGVNGNLRATVYDKTLHAGFKGVTRNRPKLIVSEQVSNSEDNGKARAAWEMNRRNGRSQTASFTCDSWRDSSGALWQVNTLAQLHCPNALIFNKTWLICEITFRRDDNGTHADITMMDPSAFALEPISQPANAQIARDMAQTAAAAKSTTSNTGGAAS